MEVAAAAKAATEAGTEAKTGTQALVETAKATGTTCRARNRDRVHEDRDQRRGIKGDEDRGVDSDGKEPGGGGTDT